MVFFIVGLEVVLGMLYITPQLRRQQHVAAQVISGARAIVSSIAHGEREVVIALLMYLQAELHLLEGFIVLFVGSDGHRSCGHAVVDEQHACGIECASRIEESKLVHARGQLVGGDGA